jgi:hypothetical protein
MSKRDMSPGVHRTKVHAMPFFSEDRSQEGRKHIFVKPFDLDELMVCIQEMIGAA